MRGNPHVRFLEGPGPVTVPAYSTSRGRLATVTVNDALESSYGNNANSNRTSYSGTFGTIGGATYDDRDRLTEYDGATYTCRESGELASKCVAPP